MDTNVDELHDPPPQRPPDDIAELWHEDIKKKNLTLRREETYLIAAVSSVVPSPMAPKS